MSWAEITKKTTQTTEIMEEEKTQEEPKNFIDLDESDEEIFNMQTGTHLLDFISELKYTFDEYYGDLLGRIQAHNIYDFFYKYIDFSASIKATDSKGEDSDTSDYETY